MATFDATKNFAKVTVSTGYDAAATSIVLGSGHGARLPQPSTDGQFNLVWWNNSDYGDPTDDPNREIVRCTARSTDTLTVTRAQEGTSATVKNSAGRTYRMALTITAKVIDDIVDNLGASSTINVTQTSHGLVVGDVVRSNGTDNQFTKAQANSSTNAESVGIVTVLTDSSNYTITTSGLVDAPAAVPAQPAGTVLFLSPFTSGALTTTEPVIGATDTTNTIGSPATDRASSVNIGGSSLIAKNAPAVQSGVITTVKIFLTSGHAGTNVKIGTFYGSGTSYTLRSYATLGAVSAGSEQTFNGLSINVEAGDFIGLYDTTAYLRCDANSGYYYKASTDVFALGGTQTYSDGGGTGTTLISAYGTITMTVAAGYISKPLAIVTANDAKMNFINFRGAALAESDYPSETYITVKMGTEADGDDNRTFSLTTGTFSIASLFEVYKNGILQESGASADYVTSGNTIAVFNTAVLDTDKITLKVRSYVSSGMTNPFTTAGDIVYSNASTVATRLGIGTANQILRTNAGATAPEWVAYGTIPTSVENFTGDDTLTAAESGKLCTNHGASGAVALTLPTAAAGLTFSFVVDVAQYLRINFATGDNGRYLTVASATAGYMRNNAIGSYVSFTAIDDTTWQVTSLDGSWSVDA